MKKEIISSGFLTLSIIIVKTYAQTQCSFDANLFIILFDDVTITIAIAVDGKGEVL